MSRRCRIGFAGLVMACFVWAVFSGTLHGQGEKDMSSSNIKQIIVEKQHRFKELATAAGEGAALSAAMDKYNQADAAISETRAEDALALLNEALALLGDTAGSEKTGKGKGDRADYGQSEKGASPSNIKQIIIEKQRRFKELATTTGKGNALSAAMDKYNQADAAISETRAQDALALLNEALVLLGDTAGSGKTGAGITGQPVVISEVCERSPFGIEWSYMNGARDPYACAKEIGARWDFGVIAKWSAIQKDLAINRYDWGAPTKNGPSLDDRIRAVPAGMSLVVNILSGFTDSPDDSGIYIRPNSYLPISADKYRGFVRALVERYDGDGQDDMPGLVAPIKYWQVDLEPLVGKGYAGLLSLTYDAIKSADPTAHVIMGAAVAGPAGGDDISEFCKQYIDDILTKLNRRSLDVLSIHYYGNATGDYRHFKDIYAYFRSNLASAGLGDVTIWSTGMSTYSGQPMDKTRTGFKRLPYQSEQQQAADLVKRYIFSLSLGVQRIFWAMGMKEGYDHKDEYFDCTGLIFDGEGASDRGNGVKKVGYFTYQMMTEKLADTKWGQIEQIPVASTNVYVYKIPKTSSPDFLYVAWWDWFNEKNYARGATNNVKLPFFSGKARITQAVTDIHGRRTIKNLSVRGGNILIPLGESPVFVERGDR